MVSLCAVSIVSLWALATPTSEDWPRFLGPHGNAASGESGLTLSWGEDGPPIAWTAELGKGFGGMAVVEGRIFALDRNMGEADVFRCLDLESGEEEWRVEWEVGGRLPYAGSRQVPWVEEEMVYAVSGFGRVYCVDREEEEEVWSLDLAQEYDAPLPMFGFAISPVVYEDAVIVAVMSDEVGLLALDRFTGDELWTTEPLGTSHSTPFLMELHGETQIVFLSAKAEQRQQQGFPGLGRRGRRDRETPEAPAPQEPSFPGQEQEQEGSGGARGRGGRGGDQDDGGERRVGGGLEDITGEGYLSGFDPESGELLWRFSDYFCYLPIPTPTKVDDDCLFVTGGYGAGSALIRRDGVDADFETVWSSPRGAQIHPGVVIEGHIYVLVNENANDPRSRQTEGGLQCLDMEGNECWRTGNDPFFGRGNLMQVGDRLLIQDGHSGVLRVVAADPKEYRCLAEANVFESRRRGDEQMWAPMALSDGRLLMRSQEELRCIDLRGASR